MKNGFIYPFANCVMVILLKINLIEYFKGFASKIYSRIKGRKLQQKEVIAAKNFAIDFYMIFKWTIVLVGFIAAIENIVYLFVVFYLIASNLYSYFYYHVWVDNSSRETDHDWRVRRLVTFLLSLFFYLFCYAYLYQFHFCDQIQWPENVVDTTNALYLSLANAFTLTYGGFAPLTQEARVLFATELINTFFFFVVILAKSIPEDR